jgi:hypothetical protein
VNGVLVQLGGTKKKSDNKRGCGEVTNPIPSFTIASSIILLNIK